MFHILGVQQGPCGWETQFLATRPTVIVHYLLLNFDALVGRLLLYIGIYFEVVTDTARLEIFSLSRRRTRNWGWGLQMLIQFINRHCSSSKYFPVRERNPGFVGENRQINWEWSLFLSRLSSACWSLVLLHQIGFEVITNTAWPQFLSQSGSRTRGLWVRATRPIVIVDCLLLFDAHVGRLLLCIGIDFE